MLLTTPDPSAPKVYRLRAAVSEDSYGDPTLDWASPARDRLRGAQTSSIESGETDGLGRPILLRNARKLIVPGRADLNAEDRVEAEGVVWRVDGTPTVRRGLASAQFTTAELVRLTAQ